MMIGKIKRYLNEQQRHYQAGNDNPDSDAHMSYTAHKLDFICELKQKIKEWEQVSGERH